LGGHPAKTPVEKLPVEPFIQQLTTVEDWHGDEEKAQVQKYQQVFNIMASALKDISVYRVGEGDVTIYFLATTGVNGLV